MEIGNNIKRIRISKKMSQRELAELSKLSKTAIQNYEYGNQNPGIETIKKIADALEVPISYLIQDVEQEKNEVKELETFEALLKNLNYSVNYEPSDPDNYYMEDEKDENGNIIEQRKVYEGGYNVIITKENFTAEFSQSEYDNLKKSTWDFIDFLIYKKGGKL